MVLSSARAIVVALALLASIAGCVASPSLPDAPSSGEAVGAAGPSRFVWNASDCREIIATFHVDRVALQAELPEGFTARPSGVPGKTGVGIDFFECGSSVLTQGPVSGGAYASFWANVDVPPELLGDAEAAFYKWDTLVPDPVAFAALAEAGAAVRSGSVTVGDLSPVGGTAGEIRFDDLAPFTVTTLPGLASPQDDGTPRTTLIREWSPAGPDGSDTVMWQVNLTQWDGRLTSGVIDVPSGSMAARLYGSTRIPSVVGLGMAHLHDGWMELATGSSATPSGP